MHYQPSELHDSTADCGGAWEPSRKSAKRTDGDRLDDHLPVSDVMAAAWSIGGERCSPDTPASHWEETLQHHFSNTQKQGRFMRLACATVCITALMAPSLASAECAADTPLKVGYSTFNVTNPYFAGIIKGMENGTAAQGWGLTVTNASGGPDRQVADIENLLTAGVDFIMLTPADSRAIAPAIAEADQDGVPVFAVGDTVDVKITQQILPDSVAAAEMAVDQIAAFLTAKYGEPKGTVVDMRGKLGLVVERDREEGFRKGIAKYPGITVVAEAQGDFQTDVANAKMIDILQAQPQIDAVWAANDGMAVGVTAAIKSSSRFAPIGDEKHIFVIGMDGAKPAIDQIRSGELDATISQNPIKMSELAVANAHAMKCEGATLEPLIHFPLMLINTANVASAEVAEYGIWGDQVE